MELPEGWKRLGKAYHAAYKVSPQDARDIFDAYFLMKEMAEALENCSRPEKEFRDEFHQRDYVLSILKKFKEWK